MESEIEARRILVANKVERGFDPRTCTEIALAMGLLQTERVVEVLPVVDETVDNNGVIA